MKRIIVLFSVLALGPAPGDPSDRTGLPEYWTWDADMINVESVEQTGVGVYVAVLDTGLVPNWTDYFRRERVATHLGTGFAQPVHYRASSIYPCGWAVEVGPVSRSTWVGSGQSTHGTHVVSTILGYAYRDNSDELAGYALPEIRVRGLAPGATIIPIRVFGDQTIPALPACGLSDAIPAQTAVFGTEATIAAGVDYALGLFLAGYRPMVINMSFGGSALGGVLKDAIDRAVSKGVIIVAAAGNTGMRMSYPGAYAPVISVGAVGWTGEWLRPVDKLPAYRTWWLKYPYSPLEVGSGDVTDSAQDVLGQVYVAGFSSRAFVGQELDLLAPGSWVRGPYPSGPGYSHLPWWSKGVADLVGRNPANFYFAAGTSMGAPHVTSIAALLLEKKPILTPRQVEGILKVTALPIPEMGSRTVYDGSSFTTVAWSPDCQGAHCDPVGAGLVQADQALSHVDALRPGSR